MGHEIVKCSECGKIIRQCRCMMKDKPIYFEVCGDCSKNEQKEMTDNEFAESCGDNEYVWGYDGDSL